MGSKVNFSYDEGERIINVWWDDNFIKYCYHYVLPDNKQYGSVFNDDISLLEENASNHRFFKYYGSKIHFKKDDSGYYIYKYVVKSELNKLGCVLLLECYKFNYTTGLIYSVNRNYYEFNDNKKMIWISLLHNKLKNLRFTFDDLMIKYSSINSYKRILYDFKQGGQPFISGNYNIKRVYTKYNQYSKRLQPCVEYMYYKNNWFSGNHREDGPSRYTINLDTNKIINVKWHVNGKNISKDVNKWIISNGIKWKKQGYKLTPEQALEFKLKFC